MENESGKGQREIGLYDSRFYALEVWCDIYHTPRQLYIA